MMLNDDDKCEPRPRQAHVGHGPYHVLYMCIVCYTILYYSIVLYICISCMLVYIVPHI